MSAVCYRPVIGVGATLSTANGSGGNDLVLSGRSTGGQTFASMPAAAAADG